jgi:hypothetical protein
MKQAIAILLVIMMLAATVCSAGAAGTDIAAAAAEGDPYEGNLVGEKADPVVTQVSTISGGLKITWSAYEGAEKYRLFIKNTSGSGKAWIKVADTAGTYYAHRGLTANTEYIYTVRAIAGNQYISGFDTEGYAFTYYPAPVPKAESVNGGVKVSWSAVAGAPLYRVYRKSGTAWVHCAYAAGTSFTDTDVNAGESYTYTVRVCSQDQKTMLSFYDKNGVSVTYIEAPVITGFASVSGGTRVSWAASAGAAQYRLFVKNTSGSGKAWLKVGDTDGLYLDHKKLAGGTTYTYTVRALDKKGGYASGFDPVGKDRLYLDPPVISSVTKTDAGTMLKWNAVGGAAKYRVYRKTFGGAWAVLGDSAGTSYTDTSVEAGVLYGYTVRCVGTDNKVSSYYINETKYYLNGEPANGKITVNGATLVFADGAVRQGYVTVNGKTYYYNAAGELMKNGLVGSKSEGYRYADKNGVVDMSYTGMATNSKGTWYVYKGTLDFSIRAAVTWNGQDYNVLNGKAYAVSSDKDRTLFKALKLVSKLTKSDMSKVQKLRKCYDYLQTETSESSPRIPHMRTLDWPIIYANDIFDNKSGNCLSYAAAFAFMAKAIGYDEVYACHSGGHGWTEIEGLVYDTEWQRNDKSNSYFGVSYYDNHTEVDYLSVKQNMPGNAWMHVKI